jgi:hypothetical protein
MQSKKAIMTSRREFLSNALGIALVSASTWPIVTRERTRLSDYQLLNGQHHITRSP